MHFVGLFLSSFCCKVHQILLLLLLLLFILSPIWTWRYDFSILMSSNFLKYYQKDERAKPGNIQSDAYPLSKLKCMSSLLSLSVCIISSNFALSSIRCLYLGHTCSGTDTILQAVHMRRVLQAELRLHTFSLEPLYPQRTGRKLTAVTGGFICLSIIPFSSKTGWFMYKSSPYRAVNTLRLSYTNHPVNAV